MQKKFPKNIQFKYKWRKYQQRVLDELDQHINDNHLHVIAPPGSGKTVLGLEAMLRLNQPTLILAPSIAIRNQWIQRFCELFLQTTELPDWLSNSIKNPKFITVSTYQGLHAACSGELEIEEDVDGEDTTQTKSVKKDKLSLVIESLKSLALGTVIIDEAHHLKNEWWKSIIKIKEELTPTIVGLTATPPYDVTYAEWSRYQELNGPVDAEISVPELISEGDLCPHQDYVHISEPSQEELTKLEDYRANIRRLFDQLSNDPLIVNLVSNHPAITHPNQEEKWIYDHMAYYSSFLIFLTHHNLALSKRHFEITGNKKTDLPKLDLEWLEILLDYYLNEYQSIEEQSKKHQQDIRKWLKQAGVLERKKIKLSEDAQLDQILANSLNKLDSIKKITKFEHEILDNELRQVILSDYIRAEFLSDDMTITKMGVVPIFESLRRDSSIQAKIGILTGSLIVIPSSSLETFNTVSLRFDHSVTKPKPLSYDHRYLIIPLDNKLRQDIVHIITQVFHLGEIQVLVGTKSLLGEGWDAPSINVLVLASFVGSFVMSNQMRGRAIRTLRENQNKTSNIWHLVCQDPTNSQGGRDIDLLRRRFKGFVGLSERDHKTIENGLGRMELPELFTPKTVSESNIKMFASAKERQLLNNQWHQAINNGSRLIEEIKIPYLEKQPYQHQKKFYLHKTIKWVLAELGTGIGLYSLEFIQQLPRLRGLLRSQEGITNLIGLFFIGVFFFFGTRLVLAFKMYVKYRDISKDIQAISNALLQTLVDTKHIRTPISKLSVEATVNDQGEVYCHLEGGSTFEKSLFINSLQEITRPVDSPRYLIIRKNTLFTMVKQKDYHAVPEALGKVKATASIFKSYWGNLVGRCELIFTKNLAGRKLLLKARFHSLASEFQQESERTNCWK